MKPSTLSTNIIFTLKKYTTTSSNMVINSLVVYKEQSACVFLSFLAMATKFMTPICTPDYKPKLSCAITPNESCFVHAAAIPCKLAYLVRNLQKVALAFSKCPKILQCLHHFPVVALKSSHI